MFLTKWEFGLWGIIIKPIFHCNAKPFVLGPGVGLDPKHHNFALPIPTCWYLKTLKFALTPMRTLKFVLSPLPTPNASQWNIGCVGSPMQNFGVGRVFLFVSISFALGPVFQWNMGLSFAHLIGGGIHLRCFLLRTGY